MNMQPLILTHALAYSAQTLALQRADTIRALNADPTRADTQQIRQTVAHIRSQEAEIVRIANTLIHYAEADAAARAGKYA